MLRQSRGATSHERENPHTHTTKFDSDKSALLKMFLSRRDGGNENLPNIRQQRSLRPDLDDGRSMVTRLGQQ